MVTIHAFSRMHSNERGAMHGRPRDGVARERVRSTALNFRTVRLQHTPRGVALEGVCRVSLVLRHDGFRGARSTSVAYEGGGMGGREGADSPFNRVLLCVCGEASLDPSAFG
jgi:hypothetical protein